MRKILAENPQEAIERFALFSRAMKDLCGAGLVQIHRNPVLAEFFENGDAGFKKIPPSPGKRP